LVRAARRAEYIPVYYLESVGGVGRALGFDAASDPARREALNRARDTGQPTVTDPLTLIQDIEREGGLVVFLPIYKPGLPQNSLQERRVNLQGYVGGAFRIRDMMNTVLRGAMVRDIEIRLYDAPGGEKKVCYMSIAQRTSSHRIYRLNRTKAFNRRRSRESFRWSSPDASG